MKLVCPAAEIVSWKAPLSNFVDKGLEADGVVRCKSAPEASPFFKEGDELWDLKGFAPSVAAPPKLNLDWLVWNATSERLVAKGDWADICAIHDLAQMDRLPKFVRISLSAYQTTGLAHRALDSKPVGNISLLVRSGRRASAEWSEAGTSMSLETEANSDESGLIVDVRILSSIQLPNQPRLDVNTAATVRSGIPLSIALDSDGRKGLELELTSSIETSGGVPFHEQVKIQQDGKSMSIMPVWKSPDSFRVGDGWLMTASLSPQEILSIISPGNADPNVDPFADTNPILNREPLPPAPCVKTPEFLRRWIKHDVLESRGWLEKVLPGIKKSGGFAGYDPIEHRLYFYSTDEVQVDSVVSLVMPGCMLRPGLITGTLEGRGKICLVARSGQKASLKRCVADKTVQRSLEIEPTIGDNDNMIDMRLHFEDMVDPQSVTRLDTSTTIMAGKSQELLSGGEDAATKSSFILQAEVLRISSD